MWTERPNALRDGGLLALTTGLILCSILSLRSAAASVPLPSTCQEVVVIVEKRGDILAQCPPETYVDILDDHVICRCGNRMPVRIDVGPSPDPTPNTEAPPKFDGRGGTYL